MRKIISVFLVFVMLFSFCSLISYAKDDSTLLDEIYQNCVDDTPEGHYLVDVEVSTSEDGKETIVDALYLPLAQARAFVSGSRIAYVYYEGVLYLQYTINGTYSYNGSTATVATGTCTKTYHNTSGGYVIDPDFPVKEIINGSVATLKYYIYYDVYNGTGNSLIASNRLHISSLYCDANGTISY